MLFHPDRPHARAAAAMRDGKGLVQVEVRHIRTDPPRLHQPDHRVHIGAVHIDLTAELMGDVADFAHGFLEHPMRRGIGDHAGRKRIARRRRFFAEILQVDITVGGGFHHHNLHPRHLRRGRVGAMRRDRDQTDIALMIAPRPVIGRDGQEPRIFPLRARIRLQRKRLIAGDFTELFRQIPDRLMIALGLIMRRERVQRAEFRPGDRHHLGGGVQLHRAGAERDHRPVQRQIAVRQAAHIAHHLGFRPVHVKDRMRQIGRLPQERVGEPQRRDRRFRGLDPEGVENAGDHRIIRQLIDRDAHPVTADFAEVDTPVARGGHDALLANAHFHGDRVKEGGRSDLCPRLGQRPGQTHRVEMHPLGDCPQAHRPVEHRIERGHHRQQRLRRADVGGGLFTADMLLARLQGQPVGAAAPRINRHADDPARHRAFELIAAGHEGRMRAAIAHRHAKTLRRAHGDIRPHRARLFQKAERQQIGRHHRHRLGRMQSRNLIGEIDHIAIGAGILENRAKDLLGHQRCGRTHLDLDPQGQSPGADHRNRLRMAVFIDKEGARLGFCHPLGHGHRLGRRRRLIQKARVGHRQAGQIADHGLEVQQSLQPPLRNLGLIGGIGGVPGRIFQNIPLDGGRGDGAVIALTDQAGHHPVFRRHLAHFRQQRMFGQRRPAERRGLPDRGGHRLGDQLVEVLHADGLEHLGHFRGAGADMAAVGEIIGVIGGGRIAHGRGSGLACQEGFHRARQRPVRHQFSGPCQRRGIRAGGMNRGRVAPRGRGNPAGAHPIRS